MNRLYATCILCTILSSSFPAEATKEEDLTIGIHSNPNVFVFQGLKEFSTSISGLTQEMKKLPTYVAQAQQSIHMIGTIAIGCAICCTGIYNFLKKEHKSYKDYWSSLGFIAVGAGLVIFSPTIARTLNPLPISV